MSPVRAAIVQAAPIPLAIGAGIVAAVAHVRRAVTDGAQLVAFGETFLGGYPLWLDEAPAAALWDHPGTRAFHRIMLEQAVTIGDPRFAALQELVDASGAIVSIGSHERVRSSLFNTQWLFRPGAAPLPHRKLVPTHGERLIWARGDGSTLGVHDAGWGNVGHLICWEHWMPLARAAMHNQREAVHIAAWPTVRETYAIAGRHYAFEGRCFVLNAGLVQHRDDLFDGLARVGGDADAKALIEGITDGALNRGGSQIVAPDARILAEADAVETIIHADLNLDEIGAGLTSLDTDGHYARPDVFELRVDTAAKDGVVWE